MQNLCLALLRYRQRVVVINWYILVMLQDIFTLKPFMESRNKKSTGLRSNTFERSLWFRYKDSKEVFGIDSFLEMWLLLTNQLIESVHAL